MKVQHNVDQFQKRGFQYQWNIPYLMKFNWVYLTNHLLKKGKSIDNMKSLSWQKQTKQKHNKKNLQQDKSN